MCHGARASTRHVLDVNASLFNGPRLAPCQVAHSRGTLVRGTLVPPIPVLTARTARTDDDGQHLPLGLLEYDWPSARLLSRIAATLLEEELGYHVVLQHRTASFMESLRQLAGCAEGEGTGILGREPDGVPQTVRGNTVRPCSAEARCHVALDSPLGRNEHTHLAFRAATPLTAPEDIGSILDMLQKSISASPEHLLKQAKDIRIQKPEP
ncbi:unnamed protein product [Symbiodinium natans]|uniref:Uncharacterized protein n=1 Tax=Symbiodinium natans TaxID=878477 RepID=A0A812LXB9_9DINO|nr:unnamed protein product [Symbiodinium natans]